MPPRAAMAPLPAALWLILATLLLRLALGWALGLGIDESYMVAAGREWRLGYFDHPPLAWWLTWGAEQVFGAGASPVLLRLPFILLFAVSTWLLIRLTTRIFDARAAFWAAVLFNLAPVFGVASGGWVLAEYHVAEAPPARCGELPRQRRHQRRFAAAPYGQITDDNGGDARRPAPYVPPPPLRHLAGQRP